MDKQSNTIDYGTGDEMIIMNAATARRYVGESLWVCRLISTDPLSPLKEFVAPCIVTVLPDDKFRNTTTRRLVSMESKVSAMTLISRYKLRGDKIFLRGFKSEEQCVSYWNDAVRSVVIDIYKELELLRLSSERLRVTLEGRLLECQQE
jgi:hypothetical protein